MSLVYELRAGHIARKFFDRFGSPHVGKAVQLLEPGGHLHAPAPLYRGRDNWALAGRMVDYLVRSRLAGTSFSLQYTGALAATGTETRVNELENRPPSCVNHVLCMIGQGGIGLQAEAEAPVTAGELTASFALAVAEGYYRSRVWPKGFVDALTRAGPTMGGGPAYEPTQQDIERVTNSLTDYFQQAEGQELFGDVDNVMAVWREARANPRNEISLIRNYRQDNTLEFGRLVGGADPDLLCDFGGERCLLEIKTISGSISADEVRQLASYLMLGGRTTAGTAITGILFPRRGELRVCRVDEFFGHVFETDDLPTWSARFQSYLKETYQVTDHG